MRILALGLALFVAAAGAAQPVMPPAPTVEPPRGETPPVDYADPAAWMCRPGVDDGTCSVNLDGVAIDAAGTLKPLPFKAAEAAAVDCFFVYPTTSLDPTIFSDMVPDTEEKRTVHGQAGRLGEVCRVFAPIYHSVTMTALRWNMVRAGTAIDRDVPYRDILAAWRSYMARDNKGRGVVLVGHSQGAILLKRLIAEEIDGKPAQQRLVAAYLAGNVDLGKGSFRSVRPCAAPGDTACVVAWSTYLDGIEGPRMFGRAPAGQEPLCVNPAAPGGGRGWLKPFVPRLPGAPAGGPPYVQPTGRISAECVTDANGAVLSLRIEPGPDAAALTAALQRMGSIGPGWGLHSLDISLVQGNMIDLIRTQAAAWAAR